jgi:aminoglycoside 3-N-acetyltransferase I
VSYRIAQLTPTDIARMDSMRAMFAAAFDAPEDYTAAPPSAAYTAALLAQPHFIALAALDGDAVVGGIAAYELMKFEQQRSEIYLYDLAVLESHRRQGIASALIERLREIGAARGAWVIFVQADTDEDDRPAIELYSKLGSREEVLHFDIAVPPSVEHEYRV